MSPYGAGIRAVRLLVPLLTGALAGGFIHLRSVDPAAIRDEALAEEAMITTQEAPPGFNLAGKSSSVPAIRAGLRAPGVYEADVSSAGQGQGVRFDVNNTCNKPSGMAEVLRARLFGVQPLNEKVTASTLVELTQSSDTPGVSSRLIVVQTFVHRSEEVAMQNLHRLESEVSRNCYTTPGGEVKTVPAVVEGRAAVALRVTVPPVGPASNPSADAVVLQRGRAIAVVLAAGVLAPFAPEEVQGLATAVSLRLATKLAGP